MGTKSPTAAKLFMIAAILCFCEIPVAFIYEETSMAGIGGIFGVFFLVGALFANRGSMVPIYAKDSMGHETGPQIGEYAAACYCGLLGLLAIAILVMFAIPITGDGFFETLPAIIPGVLGGLTAFIAGIVYSRAENKHHETHPTRTYY